MAGVAPIQRVGKTGSAVDKLPPPTYYSWSYGGRSSRYTGGDIRFGEVLEVELKGLTGLNRMYTVKWA